MKINKQFLPFIAFAILALCFGLWAGALRIGLSFPSIPNLALAHGPLMISGFLGILIPLERAVAMRKRWMFLVPILAAIGWVTALIMPNVSVYFFSLASFGAVYAGPVYDAALHAVFVGFVISMIFGHAPIIFSGIIGIPISYKPVFYIHLILLHASLIIRIFGNLTNQIEIRKMGGFLNGIAILLFIAVTIYSVVTYIIQYKKGKHNETH